MKVSELISILNFYDKDSDIIIYDDSSDSSYEISCIDTDENDDSDNNPKTVLFI
jgi:hypothetical protein